jgi:hypothetical protein
MDDCITCKGTGEVGYKPCPDCYGVGTVDAETAREQAAWKSLPEWPAEFDRPERVA